MIWSGVARTRNKCGSLERTVFDILHYFFRGGAPYSKLVRSSLCVALLSVCIEGCFRSPDPSAVSEDLGKKGSQDSNERQGEGSNSSASLARRDIAPKASPASKKGEPSNNSVALGEEAVEKTPFGNVERPKRIYPGRIYPGSIKDDVTKPSLFRLEWESKVKDPVTFVLRMGLLPKGLNEEIRIPIAGVQIVEHPLYGQLYRYYLDKAPFCPKFYFSISAVSSDGTESTSEPFEVKAPCLK